MSLVRCFVAADLPGEVRDELAALQRHLRARRVDLRWTAADTMHLTLKFLGELPPEMFGAVSRALEEPLGVTGPLRLSVSGIGAFPDPERVRVLWAGLAGDVGPLARAALVLEARAEKEGIPRERRPFAAHLTLGRSRGPGGVLRLGRVLEEFSSFRGVPFEVDSLVLYESELRPGGPVYTPRKTIALQ